MIQAQRSNIIHDYRNSSDRDENVKHLMTVLEAVNCVYLKSQFERKLTSFSKDQSLRHLYIAHEENFNVNKSQRVANSRG